MLHPRHPRVGPSARARGEGATAARKTYIRTRAIRPDTPCTLQRSTSLHERRVTMCPSKSHTVIPPPLHPARTTPLLSAAATSTDPHPQMRPPPLAPNASPLRRGGPLDRLALPMGRCPTPPSLPPCAAGRGAGVRGRSSSARPKDQLAKQRGERDPDNTAGENGSNAQACCRDNSSYDNCVRTGSFHRARRV